MSRDGSLVGHHDQGDALLLVQIIEETQDLFRGGRVRLPVGSSARRMAGRLTRARAMATRCCCPPES